MRLAAMAEIPNTAAVLGFVPGALGGICNVVVGHPMDLVKVRQQTLAANTITHDFGASFISSNPTSSMAMLRSIFMRQGLPGLYAGVSAPLLAVVPAFAISFWSFDFSKNWLQKEMNIGMEDSSVQLIALSGAFSGIPVALILGPLERIKCLMQSSTTSYSSFADCARHVYQQGGMRSVFRGTGMTVLRDVPGNAAYFASYDITKRALLNDERHEMEKPSNSNLIAATMFAGGMAGVGNWVVAIPMDVLKSRWQTAPAGQYGSVWQVLHDLLKTEGPRALFRGLAPALLRAFPANAACLLGVETAKSCIE